MFSVLILGGSCAAPTATFAAEFTARERQPTPEELAAIPPVSSKEKAAQYLKEAQFPPEFDVTIFATPPAVNYPVFVASAPDGTLFVSSDGNGSLDRKPHLGRVVRVRDLNGDGAADEVKAFVPDIDSPRGLVWDFDRLYLLHPPDISVFIDRDGDGVAEERKTLVKGIAFNLKDRPADHSSNGIELGIDGWIYAAIGDFGFMEAEGADGRKLQLRGGGVVRFRPDGSGLELYARGTRNILEVAVSPLLDGFARDNTNDGGGWDIRLHHFSGFTEHGYPTLFKNFGDEIIQPLADYGGGSGCGAAWIDEPGIPVKWNKAPFTADWGRERVFQHSLKSRGGTFEAAQEEFCKLPRVTDLDVDASSRIYAASWKGASFTWVGPEVGYVVRATPKGYKPEPLPDFDKLDPAALVNLLESSSHRRRLEAQRTLLRKGLERTGTRALRRLAADRTKPLESRVAALFALKQGLGHRSHDHLAELAKDPTIAAWAIRAAADRWDQMTDLPLKAIVAGTRSADPRVRREAVVAIARAQSASSATAVASLLGDADPVVAHATVQSMIRMRASEAAFAVADSAMAAPAARAGAFRVLQSIPELTVVEGLIARLERQTDFSTRDALITALCRLHFVEGTWKGDSWGTRPDTRGPFYQPESWAGTPRVAAALAAALKKSDAREAAVIAREMSRHRIPAGDALETLLSRAVADASMIPSVVTQLAQVESIPPTAVSLLIQAAEGADTADAVRAQAIVALAKTDQSRAWDAMLTALPKVMASKTENNLAEKARNAFYNSPRLDTVHAALEARAAKLDGQSSTLADAALLKLAARKVGAPEARDAASRAIEAGWAEPKRRLQILKATALAGDSSRAAQIVAAMKDPDGEIAEAAGRAVRQLRIDPAKFEKQSATVTVGSISPEDAVSRVLNLKGDVRNGERLFVQTGCNACHTVRADEALKGPYLGTIANIYRRRELAEAVLIPNKTIAQGFTAHHFELKDGTEVDGFVVQEAADAVTIRTITAAEQRIPVSQIAKREKQQRSLMPEGLAAAMSLDDFASLLDYIESLVGKKP